MKALKRIINHIEKINYFTDNKRAKKVEEGAQNRLDVIRSELMEKLKNADSTEEIDRIKSKLNYL